MQVSTTLSLHRPIYKAFRMNINQLVIAFFFSMLSNSKDIRLFSFRQIGLACIFVTTLGRCSIASLPAAQDEANRSEIESRKTAIKEEITNLKNHTWAGVYRQPDFDSEIVLYIAPECGAVFELKRLGKSAEHNWGTVSEKKGELVIIWKYPHEAPGIPAIECRFVIVHWADWTFLVPHSEIHSFCVRVRKSKTAAFSELKRSPTSAEIPTLKTFEYSLPTHLEAYRNLPAMEVRILQVGQPVETRSEGPLKTYRISLTLNKGAMDHVFPGMVFEVPRSSSQIRVDSVEDRTCTATVTFRISKGKRINLIRKGMLAKTRTF